jgi:hypothetical protein
MESDILLHQAWNHYRVISIEAFFEAEAGQVMCFPRLGLETGKALSGFGAKPEKQFLFWDLRSKKAIGSGCKVRGCRLQGEVRYLKLVLEIPKT